MSDAVAAWEHLPLKESSVLCQKGQRKCVSRLALPHLDLGLCSPCRDGPSSGDTQSVPVFLPGLHWLPLSVAQSGFISRRSEHPPWRGHRLPNYWRPPPLGHLSPEIPLGHHPFDIVNGVPQPCNLSQGALEATLLTSRSGQPAGGASEDDGIVVDVMAMGSQGTKVIAV